MSDFEDYLKNHLNSTISNQSTDDYIRDGLRYCSKCHTPKQHRHTFSDGRTIVHNCMCRCEFESSRKNREQEEAKQRFEQIKRLKLESVQDRSILDWTFKNDDGTSPKMHLAKQYVKKWEHCYSNHIGLLLYGDVGTGKTYFAACVANALLDRNIPVLVTNFTRLINQLSEFGEDKNSFLNSLNNYKLLVIDDLGVERQSEFVQEQVYNIIDNRYKNGQPMIITTNIPIAEIRNPQSMSYKRIYDRILEFCVPIEMTGISRREKASSQRIQEARKILFND